MSDSASVISQQKKQSNEPVVEVSVDPEEWDALVGGASGGTIFHRYGFLSAMAKESGTTLVPLLVRKGGKGIGLWPVFLKNSCIIRLGFSPPPGTLVPNLGPVLLGEGKHQADKERQQSDVAQALVEYVDNELKLGLLRFSSTSGAFDPRPYQWRGFRVRPNHTYVLNLEAGAEAVIRSFKKQLRTDARRAAQYEGIDLFEGDFETYREIIALTRKRYAEQGETWAPSNRYLEKVYHEQNKDEKRIRCWGVCEGRQLLSGVIILFFKGNAAHWIGGVRYDAPYIGLNEWLHSVVVSEAVESGCGAYELVGGNTERLCRHKAKYNPSLEVSFVCQRSAGLGAGVASVLEKDSVRNTLKKLRSLLPERK